MKKTHTTKEGREILIASMEDSHLRNMVNLLLDELVKCKQALTLKVEDLDEWQSALMDVNPKKLKNQAKQRLNGLIDKLEPYMFECMIRGIYFTDELFGSTIQSCIFFNRYVNQCTPNRMIQFFPSNACL